MKKRSLAFKLMLGGILAVVIPLSVVGIYSALRSSTALRSAAEDQAAMIAKNLATTVDVALKEELKTVISFTVDPVFKGDDQAAMGELLAALMKSVGEEYEAIFMTDAKGIVQADGLGGRQSASNCRTGRIFSTPRPAKLQWERRSIPETRENPSAWWQHPFTGRKSNLWAPYAPR